MGQQQLLLIVLGVIIVGVAAAVGVSSFQSSSIDSNRQQVIADLISLASKAQRYYRTPSQLGGGSQNFKSFGIAPSDTGNANGSYSVATAAPTAKTYVAGSDTKLSSSATIIYIIGCGKETGDDSSNKTKAYCYIDADSIGTAILN